MQFKKKSSPPLPPSPITSPYCSSPLFNTHPYHRPIPHCDSAARGPHREQLITGKLPSKDTALLPVHFSSVQWCLFWVNIPRKVTAISLLTTMWAKSCTQGEWASLSKIRLPHPSIPPPPGPWLWSDLSPARKELRGTVANVTTRAGYEGWENVHTVTLDGDKGDDWWCYGAQI